MKWRNSEGREFRADWGVDAIVGDVCVESEQMQLLGYELVDAEPVGTEGAEEFEVVCKSLDYGSGCLRSDQIRPGKTYVVREKR